MGNVRILSGKEQDRMIKNGWFLINANFRESDKDF